MSEDLLEKVGNGDREAFSALYDLYVPAVMGTSLRIVRNQAAAEDITQEVFLLVWRRASLYRPERGSPAAWITTIARNRSLDYLRQNPDRQELVEEMLQSVLEDAYETSEMTPLLRKLKPDLQKVLLLAYYADMTQEEIAAYLGIPIGTVKSRMRLALEELRNNYEK